MIKIIKIMKIIYRSINHVPMNIQYINHFQEDEHHKSCTITFLLRIFETDTISQKLCALSYDTTLMNHGEISRVLRMTY